MGKILVSAEDVILILRHDPNSSDPVEAAMILSRTFFDGPELKVPDDKIADVAEAWVIEREIRFIKAEANDEGTPEQQLQARDLTPANFTKQTDVWFEVIVMPVIEEEAQA